MGRDADDGVLHGVAGWARVTADSVKRAAPEVNHFYADWFDVEKYTRPPILAAFNAELDRLEVNTRSKEGNVRLCLAFQGAGSTSSKLPPCSKPF